METRLVLPVLLLVASLALASGVGRALDDATMAFRVEVDVLEGWLALASGGEHGAGPRIRVEHAPRDATRLVVLGEDLDAPLDGRIFWIAEGPLDTAGRLGVLTPLRPFAAPGWQRTGRHRLRISVFALERQELIARPSADDLPRWVRDRALAIASWQAGGGWLRRSSIDQGDAARGVEDERSLRQPGRATKSAESPPPIAITP